MSGLPYCGDETENALRKVEFRQKILSFQDNLQSSIDDGVTDDVLDQCALKHYFTPISDEYGCSVYGREILLPKGTVIVGKIHRHAHLNIISKGKVSVATEHGRKYMEAPCTFVSEPGLKRAVYAEEDSIWTTIHLTAKPGEDNLVDIENEVISPTYEEIGLIDSTKLLRGES